ncbi:hypothetical protein JGS22_023585 [Streptomyces sp. P38-E01]|uniref:Uncharacterized protein n=1 Tax=Streptomyces tardus TaxID=2780544 RepID=A0A949N707_9ACTN|nr:hypothetical protein [Streptomyces tardus]MBU7600529.1 hypothetical protein [Streptomyces tardus]
MRAPRAGAGIVSPGLAVEPSVWELPGEGAVRVVELGQVLPEVAHLIADLLEDGLQARRAPLRHRLYEVNTRTRRRGELL